MENPKVLCDVMYDRNPRVFMDIEIGGVHAGRMFMELFADTSPKAAEYFRALCTGENGTNQKGKPLHYKGTNIRVVYGRHIEGAMLWTDQTNLEEECIWKIPTRGDLFFSNGSFNIGLRESESWWSYAVFGKILDGMDVLKAIESADDHRGGSTEPVIIVNSGQIHDGKCLIYHNLKNYGPRFHNMIKGSKVQRKYVYRSRKIGDHTS